MLILYNQRPPYLIGDKEGNVSGLTASVADFAFRKAGIPFRWLEIPSQRQLMLLRDNKDNIAAVGWFKNSSREAFCKFSIPLYKDKKIVLLAKAGNQKVTQHKSLESLFLDKELTLLVKDGYSYGKTLDEKIKHSSIVKIATTVENYLMIKIIDSNRADCMFIAPEEANYVIKYVGLNIDDFQQITFENMPDGEFRYILFSKRVDDKTISIINKYILEYKNLHQELTN